MFSEFELFRAKKIIQQLAKQNMVSEEKIRAEMEEAIDTGFNNPDPSVQAIWESAPFNHVRPTPEEFILWCSDQLSRNL